MDDTQNARLFTLDFRFAYGGAWAGVEDLIEIVYTELKNAGRQDLLDSHAYELHMVLRASGLIVTDESV